MVPDRRSSAPVALGQSTAPSKFATRAVQHEREKTAVAVARANRVALTAHVALQRAAEISELENRLIQMAPLGEARYRAIADAAAMGLANIVGQQSMDL